MTNPVSPETAAPRATRIAPGPNALQTVGAGISFLRNPIAMLTQTRDDYGPIVRYKLGRQQVLHIVHRPEHVEHILLKNNKNYEKNTPFKLLGMLMGDGLLLNEGESWFKQRRLMQPAFQPGHFTKMAAGLHEIVGVQVKEWAQEPDGQKRNIEADMSTMARRMISYILFGKDLPPEVLEIMRILESDDSKMNFMLANLPMTPQNMSAKRRIKILDNALYHIIKERREQVANTAPEDLSPDILTSLMMARDKSTGEGMTDLQLRNEIVTLLFAGFDTTSRTITWALYGVSRNPQVEEKLHEELETVLGGKAPTYEDLAQLKYVDMIIKETMRLYPANPIIGRKAKEEDYLGDYHIPAGSLITLSPYLAHMDDTLWDNPQEFRPERFDPSTGEKAERFAYFPLGGGPRQCIGKGIASMTIPMAFAAISQNFRFRPAPNFEVVPEMKITYQSKYGVMAMRHRRKAG